MYYLAGVDKCLIVYGVNKDNATCFYGYSPSMNYMLEAPKNVLEEFVYAEIKSFQKENINKAHTLEGTEFEDNLLTFLNKECESRLNSFKEVPIKFDLSNTYFEASIDTTGIDNIPNVGYRTSFQKLDPSIFDSMASALGLQIGLSTGMSLNNATDLIKSKFREYGFAV